MTRTETIMIIGFVTLFISLVYPTTVAVSVTCFKTGEQTDGLNKICFYDCVGSAAAITIGAAQLCPLTITR